MCPRSHNEWSAESEVTPQSMLLTLSLFDDTSDQKPRLGPLEFYPMYFLHSICQFGLSLHEELNYPQCLVRSSTQ